MSILFPLKTKITLKVKLTEGFGTITALVLDIICYHRYGQSSYTAAPILVNVIISTYES